MAGDGTWQNRIVGHGEESPEQLVANPLNWRIHPKGQQAALQGTIDDIGFIRSVTVNRRTGFVLDGHLRVTLALRSGQKSIPVEYVDLSEAEEAEALATLDPIAAMAAADKSAVDNLLKQVQTSNQAVQEMLAEVAAKAGLYTAQGDAAEPADPKTARAAELLAEWRVAPGQIWSLGKHKFLCGDSTDAVAVARLLDDASAEITFTSPPYNVAAESNLPNKDKYKQESDKYLQATDALDSAAYLQFLLDFTNLALAKSQYVFVNVQSVAGNKLALVEYLYQMRDLYADTLIWDKQFAEPAMAHNVLNSRYEYVHIFSRKANRAIGAREFRGTIDNVLTLNSRQGNANADLHKAVFPVDFALWFIERFSNAGGVVYEPFCGTGTTLLACEQLGRVGRAVELEPTYVAIALQRWVDTFGVRPELLDG